jgi:hypothetical protein
MRTLIVIPTKMELSAFLRGFPGASFANADS